MNIFGHLKSENNKLWNANKNNFINLYFNAIKTILSKKKLKKILHNKIIFIIKSRYRNKIINLSRISTTVVEAKNVFILLNFFILKGNRKIKIILITCLHGKQSNDFNIIYFADNKLYTSTIIWLKFCSHFNAWFYDEYRQLHTSPLHHSSIRK